MVGNGDDIMGQSLTRGSVSFEWNYTNIIDIVFFKVLDKINKAINYAEYLYFDGYPGIRRIQHTCFWINWNQEIMLLIKR